QVLVDIRDLLRLATLNHTIALFERVSTPVGRRPRGELAAKSELETRFGITYRAPCDARATGLAAGSLDCVTSSNTLEHIPEADIRAILRECHRCLRDDGVMSFLIDYQDHYSYFDDTINGYNFLKYSDRSWTYYNPSLHYQNRLRHKDYLALFQETGWEILEERRHRVKGEDRAAVARLRLDGRFKPYSLDERAVRDAPLVLRKRTP